MQARVDGGSWSKVEGRRAARSARSYVTARVPAHVVPAGVVAQTVDYRLKTKKITKGPGSARRSVTSKTGDRCAFDNQAMYTGDQARFYAPIATLCPNANVHPRHRPTSPRSNDGVFSWQHGITIDAATLATLTQEPEVSKLGDRYPRVRAHEAVLQLGRHAAGAGTSWRPARPRCSSPTPTPTPACRRSRCRPRWSPLEHAADCAKELDLQRALPDLRRLLQPHRDTPPPACCGRTSSTDPRGPPDGAAEASARLVPCLTSAAPSRASRTPSRSSAPHRPTPRSCSSSAPDPWGREAVTDNRLPDVVRDHLGSLDLKVFLLAEVRRQRRPRHARLPRPRHRGRATTSAARCSTGPRTSSTSTSPTPAGVRRSAVAGLHQRQARPLLRRARPADRRAAQPGVARGHVGDDAPRRAPLLRHAARAAQRADPRSPRHRHRARRVRGRRPG